MNHPFGHKSACPACGNQHDKILVCESCWWKIPAKDRVSFGKMYVANSREALKGSKAQKIIRDLKAQHAP